MKSKINSGQKLLKKAKKIIPGGNQILSKRSERFLPNLWPAYYKKAKGCKLWDLDNKQYYDFAGMGVNSCILGYADPDVNKAINAALNLGSMSTHNCVEEVNLTNKLLKLHSWARMARYARTGGEACSIAVRIARAATGKEKILFCGYHGWHDWYLSANIHNKKNLDNQLLPGLDSIGVLKKLAKSSIPFEYNNINSFKKAIKKNKKNIAAIIMEPQRMQKPNKNFLRYIKQTSKKINSVLIFDEITSGFHDNLGGIHLKLRINPDMAIFSKSLGNGVPIAAIIGKKTIMDYAQDTFISSTMWSEKIGFAAALATIKKLEQKKINNRLVLYGELITDGWKKIANKYKIKIKVSGLKSMPNFVFDCNNSNELITYFTQEMLNEGFLASNSLCVSYAFEKKIIKKYLESFDKVFNKINNILLANKRIPLMSKSREMSFKRLV